MVEKIANIMLIEDDENECTLFQNYILSMDNIKLVATTNSSEEALNYIKAYSPEGVILDMELNYGFGSGYEFLRKLRGLGLEYRPVVVVVTKIDSEVAYKNIHSYGVPIIFYKDKLDYSQELVVNTLYELIRTVRKTSRNLDLDSGNITVMDKNRLIKEKIATELEKIGVGEHLKGKKYLEEAIYYLVDKGVQDVEPSAMNHLVKVHHKTQSNMIRVMQTAIIYAWRTSSVDTLEKHYTAIVNSDKGIPTVNEFIYYYANKIYNYFDVK
jgi:DNA-binding NarL/FixJ family response regulator